MDATGQQLPEDLESMAPGPQLAALLAAVDRRYLSEKDRLRLARARNRLASHVQAELLADLHSVTWQGAPGEQPLPEDDPYEWASTEVAFALRWTSMAASRRLEQARCLIEELPAVHTALSAGVIDVPKALVISELTGWLDDVELARQLADRVLDQAPEWTTGQLRARLRSLVLTTDPDAAERRCAQAVRTRRVEVTGNPDGSGEVWGRCLPPQDTAAAWERLTAIARAAQAAGDDRSIDQLRADALLDLLIGEGVAVGEPLTRHHAGLPEADQRPGETDLVPGMTGVGDGLPGEWRPATAHPGRDQSAGRQDRSSPPPDRSSPTYPRPDRGAITAPHPDRQSPTGIDRHGPAVIAGAGPHRPFGIDAPASAADTPASPAADTPADSPASPAADTPADSPATATNPPPSRGRPGVPGPAPRRGVVELHISLSTLLGWDDLPGELAGFGPVLADIARQVVRGMPDAQWRYSVYDDLDTLVHHGTTRARPAPDLHPRQITARRPRAPDARFVRARNRTCTAPGCRQPARGCDLDHTVAWVDDGATTPDNLGPLCRRHHRFKHSERTDLIHFGGGSYGWTTPRGMQYLTRPSPPLYQQP